jgi:very-short-patch-repair endonuclease
MKRRVMAKLPSQPPVSPIGQSWKSPQGRLMWNVDPVIYYGIHHVEASSATEAAQLAFILSPFVNSLDKKLQQTDTHYLIQDSKTGKWFIYRKSHPQKKWVPTKVFAAQARRNPNDSERIMYQMLKRAQEDWLKGYTIKFQKPVHKYTLDFYIPKAKLGIEIDGESHDDKKYSDYDRDRFLNDLGIAVLRVPKDWVLDDVDKALRKIRNAIEGKGI